MEVLDVLGRYELLRLISRGGMGEIYLARVRGAGGFEKKLVIKRILSYLVEEDEFVQKFIDEANIVKHLTHGNIVPVFDMGEADNGELYIAMEYVEGRDLRDVLKRARRENRPLPVGVALWIVAELCKGLGHAHRKTDADGRPLHIVHRDISPSNLLISREGEVKVADFGIAKARDRLSRSITGRLQGKFCYMSPEQASGKVVDARSDIFSTGVVLYELLTHRRPFESERDLETLDRVKTLDPPPPSHHRPELAPEVDAIVMKALTKDPDERYPQIDELERAIMGHLYGSGDGVTSRDVVHALEVLFPDGFERPEARLSEGASSPMSLEDAFDAEVDRLLASGAPPSGRVAVERAALGAVAESGQSSSGGLVDPLLVTATASPGVGGLRPRPDAVDGTVSLIVDRPELARVQERSLRLRVEAKEAPAESTDVVGAVEAQEGPGPRTEQVSVTGGSDVALPSAEDTGPHQGLGTGEVAALTPTQIKALEAVKAEQAAQLAMSRASQSGSAHPVRGVDVPEVVRSLGTGSGGFRGLSSSPSQTSSSAIATRSLDNPEAGLTPPSGFIPGTVIVADPDTGQLVIDPNGRVRRSFPWRVFGAVVLLLLLVAGLGGLGVQQNLIGAPELVVTVSPVKAVVEIYVAESEVIKDDREGGEVGGLGAIGVRIPDGRLKRLGNGGYQVLGLDNKRYAVTVKAAGFKTSTKLIKLRHFTERYREFVLEPLTPTSPTLQAFSVESAPSGALVKIDGRVRGETPLVLDFRKGVKVQVTVQSPLPGVPDEVRYYGPKGKDGPLPEALSVRFRSPVGQVSADAGVGGVAGGDASQTPGLAPDAVEVGSLRVGSTPSGASIFINGQATGRTTPARVKVPAGIVTVVLSRQGHQSESVRVTVPPGEAKSLSLRLREKPSAGAPQDAEDVIEAPPKPVTYHKVNLVCIPPADAGGLGRGICQFFIDGKLHRDERRSVFLSLSEGPHTVRAVLLGSPKVTGARTITVRPGVKNTFTINLVDRSAP